MPTTRGADDALEGCNPGEGTLGEFEAPLLMACGVLCTALADPMYCSEGDLGEVPRSPDVAPGAACTEAPKLGGATSKDPEKGLINAGVADVLAGSDRRKDC